MSYIMRAESDIRPGQFFYYSEDGEAPWLLSLARARRFAAVDDAAAVKSNPANVYNEMLKTADVIESGVAQREDV